MSFDSRVHFVFPLFKYLPEHSNLSELKSTPGAEKKEHSLSCHTDTSNTRASLCISLLGPNRPLVTGQARSSPKAYKWLGLQDQICLLAIVLGGDKDCVWQVAIDLWESVHSFNEINHDNLRVASPGAPRV